MRQANPPPRVPNQASHVFPFPTQLQRWTGISIRLTKGSARGYPPLPAFCTGRDILNSLSPVASLPGDCLLNSLLGLSSWLLFVFCFSTFESLFVFLFWPSTDHTPPCSSFLQVLRLFIPFPLPPLLLCSRYQPCSKSPFPFRITDCLCPFVRTAGVLFRLDAANVEFFLSYYDIFSL